MILEFEKIGKIEVMDLTYNKGNGGYTFSEEDKHIIEEIIMEELVSATLFFLLDEWSLIVYRREYPLFRDDFFVFKAVSDVPLCTFYTY